MRVAKKRREQIAPLQRIKPISNTVANKKLFAVQDCFQVRPLAQVAIHILNEAISAASAE